MPCWFVDWAADGLIPMSQLPFTEEAYLLVLLERWLPHIPNAPTGEQLEHIAREAAQQYLQEEEAAGNG